MFLPKDIIIEILLLLPFCYFKTACFLNKKIFDCIKDKRIQDKIKFHLEFDIGFSSPEDSVKPVDYSERTFKNYWCRREILREKYFIENKIKSDELSTHYNIQINKSREMIHCNERNFNILKNNVIPSVLEDEKNHIIKSKRHLKQAKYALLIMTGEERKELKKKIGSDSFNNTQAFLNNYLDRIKGRDAKRQAFLQQQLVKKIKAARIRND